MQTKKSKIFAERVGRFSETIAVIFLRLKGYRILKRRYKTHVGEIDIIAARWKTLVILEIKYRKTRSDAAESVTYKQRQRIERATIQFIQTHKGHIYTQIRFDVILISLYKGLHHLKDAWRSDQ